MTSQIDLQHPRGIDGYLHFVAQEGAELRPAEQRFADRTPRLFHVCAVLTKVHTQHTPIHSEITPSEGGCFIITQNDRRIQTPEGNYELFRNALGELALATRSLTATWYDEACEIFLAGLTPTLDHFSYLSNTPIVVDRIRCEDETNHIIAVSYRMPYGNVDLSEGVTDLSTLLFPVYGLYREAVNASSNFYRFLCFYKILEGIFRQIRPQFFPLARAQGISIATSPDVVPEDTYLRQFQPDYIGRKIHELYDGEFQKQYRDSVAHFALTDGHIANPSAHRESTRFANIVYLAQVCARELIRKQEDYFRQFFSAGGQL
jgi:hypothetical protein